MLKIADPTEGTTRDETLQRIANELEKDGFTQLAANVREAALLPPEPRTEVECAREQVTDALTNYSDRLQQSILAVVVEEGGMSLLVDGQAVGRIQEFSLGSAGACDKDGRPIAHGTVTVTVTPSQGPHPRNLELLRLIPWIKVEEARRGFSEEDPLVPSEEWLAERAVYEAEHPEVTGSVDLWRVAMAKETT